MATNNLQIKQMAMDASNKALMEYISCVAEVNYNSLGIPHQIFENSAAIRMNNIISISDLDNMGELSGSKLNEAIFLHRLITIFTQALTYDSIPYVNKSLQSSMDMRTMSTDEAKYSPLGILYEDIILDLKTNCSIREEFSLGMSYVGGSYYYSSSSRPQLPIAFLTYGGDANIIPRTNTYFLLIENKCYLLNNITHYNHVITDMLVSPQNKIEKAMGESVPKFSSYESLIELIYEFHDDYADFMEEVKLYE